MKRLYLFLFQSLCFSFLLIAQSSNTTIAIDASSQEYQISKNIYGQFSEHLGHLIYGGIWVGPDSPIPNIDGIRKDVVDALREIKVPVLRWPGGCFADEYHWMNGIGPRDARPKMINTNWGNVTEDNSFGTHEFLELCSLIGCEPYITGNVGSGTVKELSEWVEYINSDNVGPMTDLRKKNGQEKSWGVRYWGIGNESWGCGGNMLPEFYSDQVRRYGTYMRNYGDHQLFKIASGPNGDDYTWTDVLMKHASAYFDGLSLHYYASADQRTATDFDEAGWFDIMKKTLQMDELIKRHSAIMDLYDPFKRIALVVDEWGTWYKADPGTNPHFLYQQNTIEDAVAAGTNLNIFNNHCDRVRMTNIAQVVNVLQSMILTDGNKMVLTPTYYVFDMYKVHQDAMMIPVNFDAHSYIFGSDTLDAINCSASMDSTGTIHISICNIDPDASRQVSVDLRHFDIKVISGKILTGKTMDAHNTFENPRAVQPAVFTDFDSRGTILNAKMPPMSVVVLTLNGKLKSESRAAIELVNPEHGVTYRYFEVKGESMPAFATLTPQSSGVIDKFVLPRDVRASNFGVEYEGYVMIPAEGMYTFFTTSDDGSAIVIDGKLVVNNDGRHAAIEKSGYVYLQKGFHKITLMYFQASGGMELSASIKGPDIPKEEIPREMLFRTK